MNNDLAPVPGEVPPSTFDPAHPYVANGRNAQPTWRIADTSNPNLKPWAAAQMKKAKINDVYAKGGWIRDDGSMIHDMYLMQVKSPDKSTEPWDYYNIVETFKGETAWTSKAETKCSLWK